ncbi:hypothetical protein [Saccharibacillus sacchari]|uniref:Uncharacterized protein n=1 Tax=Saccharibacillus sacchari TaxID=456493 RepID=A0ACC6PG56_9BACL
MKSRFKPAVFGMAMVVGLTGLGAGSALAAPSTSELDWKYDVPYGYDLGSSFAEGIFAGDNLYVYNRGTSDNVVIQAFDQDQGDKENWGYDFKGTAKGLTSGDSITYDQEGNSYFLRKKAGDKQYKLEAVDANGKLKWSNPVPGEGGKSIVPDSVIAKSVVGESGKQLHVLGNGDIVVSHQTFPKTGEVYQTFYTFGKDGKVKSTKKIKGSEFGSKGGALVFLPDDKLINTASKFQLFKSLNDLKKPIVEYTLPKWTSIDLGFANSDSIHSIFSFGGGETLIGFRVDDYSQTSQKPGGSDEIDISNLKTSKSLILFDAKGQKTWERNLAKNAVVLPTANGFVLQTGNKLELYGKDNKLKTSKTLEGSALKLSQAENTDEIVVTDAKAGTFLSLNPKDLSVKYELDLSETAAVKSTYAFLYEGAGELYVHAVDDNVNKTVSHYSLK